MSRNSLPRPLWASRLGNIWEFPCITGNNGGGAGWVYPTRHFLTRFVSPLAVAVVLFFKVRETGLFDWLAGLF